MSGRSARLVLRAYGRTIAIEAPTEAIELVRDGLPATYRAAIAAPEQRWRLTRTAKTWQLWREAAPIATAPDVGNAAERLLSDLELWVAEHALRAVFVHAGCAVVDGQAIVIPGRSMSGKSSLTAALVRAGATYWSDEFAVLDAHGQVRPYPRSLSIRPYDGRPPQRTPVAALGGTAGRGPRPVGLVLAVRFDANAGWDVRPLTRGETVLRLLDNTVPAQRRPRATLNALDRATASAIGVAGTRGDADQAAAYTLDLLGSR